MVWLKKSSQIQIFHENIFGWILLPFPDEICPCALNHQCMNYSLERWWNIIGRRDLFWGDTYHMVYRNNTSIIWCIIIILKKMKKWRETPTWIFVPGLRLVSNLQIGDIARKFELVNWWVKLVGKFGLSNSPICLQIWVCMYTLGSEKRGGSVVAVAADQQTVGGCWFWD